MLVWIAWVSIGVAIACALVITLHEVRHPQSMGVMNAVWPITALYLSVVGLWWYFRTGRTMARDAGGGMSEMHGSNDGPPTWSQSFVAASHCGAGCVLADIVVESGIYKFGLTVAGSTLLASYAWDFVGAWAVGIAFQYFAIKPMRHLSVGEGIVAAIKADTLSIAAFQVGMYAWMAVVRFWLFPSPHLESVSPVFWLMMQVAMVFGFLTTTPMSRWLVKIGLKERML